jgi:hypothetical protein
MTTAGTVFSAGLQAVAFRVMPELAWIGGERDARSCRPQ